VRAPGEVAEVPHVEAGVPVALAVQVQDALDLRHGRFAGRGLAAAPVVEAQDTVALIPAPAAQAARIIPRMSVPCSYVNVPANTRRTTLNFHGALRSDRGIEHVVAPFDP
jgi:hypothetical protein